jgi:mannose-6-phosphate isomerase
MDTEQQQKSAEFAKAIAMAEQTGLRIQRIDATRPWGGFLVFDEDQAQLFAEEFFDEVPAAEIITGRKLSPKILLVAPGQRLSWQYHFRRAEIWKVLQGPVAISVSPDDREGAPQIFTEGQIVRLAQGERHRLIGLETWGMIAEIWQHTDALRPSDEDDIVRLQDDYGR